MKTELATEWKESVSPDVTAQTEAPTASPLISFGEKQPDESQTLLGRRFLCRKGGLLFLGPSGIGKSSASVQQDLLWGLGKTAFGIAPARPLRILTIQAENDDGDLSEMVSGVLTALQISSDDRKKLREQVFYASERARTGLQFLHDVIRPMLEKHKPDLLRLDPLLAFLGADINDARETALFLRNALNPLVEEFDCGVIINHHTPKVVNRDTRGWRPSDWMYAGAGSADVTNWARAILVLDPTHSAHVFKLIGAKRGGRLGWRDANGDPKCIRFFCHDTTGRLAWRDGNEDDELDAEIKKPKGNRAPLKTKEELLALVPASETIPKAALLSRAQLAGFGLNRARNCISELENEGSLFEHLVKRPRTNPEKHIARFPQDDD